MMLQCTCLFLDVRLKDSEEPAMIDPDNNYVPWNKPGGGAPIYNERGVVQATRRSHNAEQVSKGGIKYSNR